VFIRQEERTISSSFLEKNVLKIGRKLRGIRDDDEERIRNS
jgi:hypothetical protein